MRPKLEHRSADQLPPSRSSASTRGRLHVKRSCPASGGTWFAAADEGIVAMPETLFVMGEFALLSAPGRTRSNREMHLAPAATGIGANKASSGVAGSTLGRRVGSELA